MGNRKFCQSSSMPLDSTALLGTEKDGSLSQDCCKYCFRHGAFTHPDLSPDGMKAHMTRIMGDRKMPLEILKAAINRLPN